MEIASLILGDALAIGHDPKPHAAYVASWIKVLQDDPLEVFRAAAAAEKIHDYVLGFEQQQRQTQAPAVDQPEPEPITEARPAVEHTEPERVYLQVPFKEKDDAKALGARWDRQQQAWYLPPGVDPTPFARWTLGATTAARSR